MEKVKHFPALIIKYIFVAIATSLVLTGVLGFESGLSLWVALVLTLALYLLGDLIILPSFGNITATIADSGVALLLTWLAPLYSRIDSVPFISALSVAVLIGIAEFFFHNYLQRSVLPGPMAGSGE